MEQDIITSKRVYTLYRVSTLGQVEKDDIPMQKQRCHEFIQEKGWTLVREFSEKGVSGYKVSAKDRDAIQEIQRDAVAGKFDVLLVFMFDRLGRKDDETPFVVEWFCRNGIEVWSAVEGQQRFDNHVDKLMNYIRYWQASGESLKTSIRTKTRIGQLTEEGHYTGGTVPFGYKLVQTGRTNKRNRQVSDLAVNEEEAAIVRLIFQKYVTEGYGAYRLSHFLQENGYHMRGGKDFTNTTITKMLKKVIYTGIIKNGESQSQCIDDLRIVDDDLFQRAQNIAHERTQPHGTVPMNLRGQSLLVGRIFCAHCGNRLTLTCSGHKQKNEDGTLSNKYRARYQCHYGVRHPGLCDGQTVYSVDKLDKIVDQVICGILSYIKSVPEQDLISVQHQKDLGLARIALEQATAAYEEAQQDLADYRAETLRVIRGQSNLSSDLLNSLIKEAEEKQTAAKSRLDAATERYDSLVESSQKLQQEYKRIMSWADLYQNCSFDAKKMIVCQLIKAVHVGRNYEMTVDLNVSFESLQSFKPSYYSPTVTSTMPDVGKQQKRAPAIMQVP